jgi:serine/threonine protein kinase
VIINNQLSALPEGTRIALSIVEALTIPRSAGDCEVVVYLNPGVNALGRYFPNGSINDLLLPWQASTATTVIGGGKEGTGATRRRKDRTGRNALRVADDVDGDFDVRGDMEGVDAEAGMPSIAAPSGIGEEIDCAMELDETSAFTSNTNLPLASHTDLSATLVSTDPSAPAPNPLLPLSPQPSTTAANEAWDVMDLASFLEFSIASTHCLETLHKSGHKHREVRANAFHVNIHSGVVRFAHFGNRSESLETTGGPSQLVLRASGLLAGPHGSSGGDPEDGGEDSETEAKRLKRKERDEGSEFGGVEMHDTRKVKEAICYLAPEQTGTAETNNEDHRTDLYALGVLFWTLLVGHGTLPFEGSPVELLHKVVQVRPREVHEIRRDVPVVLSAIIAKVRICKSSMKRIIEIMII